MVVRGMIMHRVTAGKHVMRAFATLALGLGWCIAAETGGTANSPYDGSAESSRLSVAERYIAADLYLRRNIGALVTDFDLHATFVTDRGAVVYRRGPTGEG